MQNLLANPWLKTSVIVTTVAVLLTFLPFSPVAVLGGLLLIGPLPGLQWARWLGLYYRLRNFETLALSLIVGLVTSPILIYWSSLLFGYSRGLLLTVFPLYIIIFAVLLSIKPTENHALTEQISGTATTRLIAALLIGFTALSVFLAYFEVETARGYFPVQMEDWQKHYGVAFSLRYTGIPPTSMFFYSLFPNDTLVYYYFLHLNAATLDLLQNGGQFLYQSFVLVIVLASINFGIIFFLLARTLFNSQKVAVWSLAFATVIGGLDVIPIVHRTIQKYRENFPDGPLPPGLFLPREHIDNWVSALSLRINTFFAYHIWVPQHLTGLAIICLGCYFYLKIQDRRKLFVIIPLLLFALLGHSTWIAAIASVGLFIFALTQIFSMYRQHGLDIARKLFLSYALIALIFAVIAAPFILSLIGPNAPKSGIVFEIHTLDSWWILRPFQAIIGPGLYDLPWILRPFQATLNSDIGARLLDLPLHLFIEMGALLVAGLAGLILYWRNTSPTLRLRSPLPSVGDFAGQAGQVSNPQPLISNPSTSLRTGPQSPPPLLPTPSSLLPFWLSLLITGTITVLFFASGRAWAEMGLVLNNDLGLRALMPGQLALALFAGYFMARLPNFDLPRWSKLATTGALSLLIALGAGYAGWEFTSMGLAKYWADPQLSPDVYHTLRDLPNVTQPQDKPFPVVQHRLHRNASRFQLSLGGRPIGFSTGEAVVFHHDVQALALAHELSREAFDNGLPLRSYQLFHNLGADYIFVGPAERETMRHPEKYQHPQYFQQVYRRGDYEIYQVQPLPFDQQQPLAGFDDDAIQFYGYYLDTRPAYPGDSTPVSDSAPSVLPKALVTAWQVIRPIDKNYTAFIHFVDDDGNIVAQADHQLWAWDVKSEGPTTTWMPKLLRLDTIPVPQAALAANTPLTLRIGLWLPDSGQQFPAHSQSLQLDQGGRLVIGRLGD